MDGSSERPFTVQHGEASSSGYNGLGNDGSIFRLARPLPTTLLATMRLLQPQPTLILLLRQHFDPPLRLLARLTSNEALGAVLKQVVELQKALLAVGGLFPRAVGLNDKRVGVGGVEAGCLQRGEEECWQVWM